MRPVRRLLPNGKLFTLYCNEFLCVNLKKQHSAFIIYVDTHVKQYHSIEVQMQEEINKFQPGGAHYEKKLDADYYALSLWVAPDYYDPSGLQVR